MTMRATIRPGGWSSACRQGRASGPDRSIRRGALLFLVTAWACAVLLVIRVHSTVEAAEEIYALPRLEAMAAATLSSATVGGSLMSFVNAPRGVSVDLSAGTAAAIARIMPLGDSITHGVVTRTNRDTPGYRGPLWRMALRDGGIIDFVGPQRSAVPGPVDPDHAGFPGRTLGWAIANISDYLGSDLPDVILMMFGTNDTNETGAEVMTYRAAVLVDRIVARAPDSLLLVADPPPIRSDGQPAHRREVLASFRPALLDAVSRRAALGLGVRHVSMAVLNEDDISRPPEDNGLHPTTGGYCRMAEVWAEALRLSGISAGRLPSAMELDLSGITNLVGSSHNDRLSGDAGPNLLFGGPGNDVLVPGGGGDDVWGGFGADLFMFRAEDVARGIVTVHDFDPQEGDRLDLSGFAALAGREAIRFIPSADATVLALETAAADGPPAAVPIARFPGVSLGPEPGPEMVWTDQAYAGCGVPDARFRMINARH